MKTPRRTVGRTRFVVRPYRRIATSYDSYYMSGSVIGKGIVTNLSRTGLRIFGDHSLTPGTRVSIRLQIDGADSPLPIACASVCWANQYEFGLRIEDVTPQAAHRVAELITADLGLRSTNVR